MFVMIRKYTGCKDVQEANRRINNLVKAVIELPGFESYAVVDLGGDQLATVSLFETREQVERSAEAVRPLVREHIADMLPNPPEITIGEVLSLHRK